MENKKPIPYGLNAKENEKSIPYGLKLASFQRPKKLKEERETNSLRSKTCFQSTAKEREGERETNSLWIKTCFHSMAKRT